jgi:hypothetical protein
VTAVEKMALSAARALDFHRSIGNIQDWKYLPPDVGGLVVTVASGRAVIIKTATGAVQFCEGMSTVHQAMRAQPMKTAGQIRANTEIADDTQWRQAVIVKTSAVK